MLSRLGFLIGAGGLSRRRSSGTHRHSFPVHGGHCGRSYDRFDLEGKARWQDEQAAKREAKRAK